MKRVLSLIVIGLLGFSMFSVLAPLIAKALITDWYINPTPLPTPTFRQGSFARNGKVYLIGPYAGAGAEGPNVYYADINPDGTTGSWTETTPLPEYREQPATVVWNNFVYAMGGAGPVYGGRAEQNTVYYASINTDDTIGDWGTTTQLPDRVSGIGAVVWNDRIYVMGGWNGYIRLNDVHFAEINEADGSLGSWQTTTSLPLTLNQMCTVVYDGTIYIVGGINSRIPQSIAYYATIDETDGTLGAWTATTSLPEGRARAGCALIDNSLYVIGGHQGEEGVDNTPESTVYRTTIEALGLGSWEEMQGLPEARREPSVVMFNGRIYVMGGRDTDVNPRDTIYYSAEEVVTFPAGAWYIAGHTEGSETILHAIDVDSGTPGDQQIVFVSPGQTVSISYTLQMWSSAGPGVIKQALFTYSWALSWPPWDAYTPLYDGGSGGYYPGFYQTDSFSITAPSELGEYNVWFCSEAHYSMNQAMQGFTAPPTMLPHAKIAVTEQPSVPQLPRLHTDGRYVKDEHGNTVHLYGVNKPGLEWTWGDYDGDGIKEAWMYNENDDSEYHVLGWIDNGQAMVNEEDWSLIRSWGCNVIRLGFQQEWWEQSEDYRKIIDKSIETSEKFGMYTILDNHWTDSAKEQHDGPWGPDRDYYCRPHDWESWKVMWEEVAERYIERSDLLFDIWNEPTYIFTDLNGNGNHDVGEYNPSKAEAFLNEWRNNAQDCANRIRNTENDAIILISATDWGHSGIWWAVWSPITGGNIAYTLHWYQDLTPGPSSELGIKLWLFVGGWWNLKNVAPVITGEFNVADETAALGSQEQWMRNFCSVMDDWDIHFLGWGWYPEEWTDPPPWEFALLHASGTAWTTPSKGGEILIEEIAKAKLNDPVGGSHSIPSMLTVSAFSPVNIMTTTFSGTQVGYDSTTGQVVNEIPDAAYSGPDSEPQIIAIPAPPQGVYIIDRFGTSLGPYTVTIESRAENGAVVDSETWTGTASSGEVERGSIQLFEDGTFADAPHSVIPEVPLGTIMASAAMIIALVAYFVVPRWRRKRLLKLK